MTGPHFTCEGCGKTHAWKPDIAGKRAKCKCGFVMTVPATEPGDDSDLYDLAPTDEPPKQAVPRPQIAPIVATSAPRAAPRATTRAATVAAVAPSPVIGYGGPMPKERDRFSREAMMDQNRDVYVPVGLLVGGLLIYVLYYAVRYHLSGVGIVYATLGLSLLTAFKAALMIGFALVVAGPLGVSFGGLWTAILKLAAIAVFSDGITTWLDAGVEKFAGGVGGFGGFISFPIVLGIYWGLMIYLFSMDPGDSWMVVMLLAVFDSIVRWALLFALLAGILSFGGASGVSLPGGGGKASKSNLSDTELYVLDLKDEGYYQEARKWAADGHATLLEKETAEWYSLGAKDVFFNVGRDLAGKPQINEMYIELPEDKEKRAKILESLGNYYKIRYGKVDPEEIKDTGEKFIEVRLSIVGQGPTF